MCVWGVCVCVYGTMEVASLRNMYRPRQRKSVCAKRRVAYIDYRSRRSPWSHCSRRDSRAGRDKTPPPPSGKTRAHRAPPHGRVVSVPPRVPDRPSAAPDPRSTSVALTAPTGCGGCPPIDPPHEPPYPRWHVGDIRARGPPHTVPSWPATNWTICPWCPARTAAAKRP